MLRSQPQQREGPQPSHQLKDELGTDSSLGRIHARLPLLAPGNHSLVAKSDLTPLWTLTKKLETILQVSSGEHWGYTWYPQSCFGEKLLICGELALLSLLREAGQNLDPWISSVQSCFNS